MLLIDVTIVTVALPDMARQLNTTFSDLQWVIDLYALVLGALVLTVGAVADRLGRRRIYLTGLVLFAASSLACGLAPNVGVLIAARGLRSAPPPPADRPQPSSARPSPTRRPPERSRDAQGRNRRRLTAASATSSAATKMSRASGADRYWVAIPRPMTGTARPR